MNFSSKKDPPPDRNYSEKRAIFGTFSNSLLQKAFLGLFGLKRALFGPFWALFGPPPPRFSQSPRGLLGVSLLLDIWRKRPFLAFFDPPPGLTLKSESFA